MGKKYLYILFFITVTKSALSQPSLRGIYINNFDLILGNSSKEDSLLQYALDSSYNYMALYDLHTFNLNNTNTADMLATFIKRARLNYGIQYVGAVGESYSSFRDAIAPYNNGRSDDNERFNVFNLEFEFWTTSAVNPGGYYCTQYLQQANCSCDTSGGFKFFIKQIHQIDSLAAVQQVMSETYLGWFNQGQGSQIQQNVDRVLLHAYRTNTTSLYGYSTQRLQYLASNNTSVDVAPIFSSEPVFMGPWLNSHAQIEAYNNYIQDYNNDNSSWKQYINMQGYHWFDYGYMPKPAPGSSGTFNPILTASGPTTFCSGGSITLTATAGDSYAWSNGETTRSVTVSTSGSLSCDVTLNSITRTTPLSTISVKNNPTATITAGNPAGGLVTLSANVTPGSGTISNYEWQVDNSTINGATSGSYDAYNSGDYQIVVTNTYGCTAGSNIITVSLPPPASCVPSTPGGMNSTASTELSQILMWDPGQTGDSIVVRYKPLTGTSTYTRIRMLNQGQSSVQITGLQSSTTYVWNVKMVCGTTQGTYSAERSFSTGSTNTGIHAIPPVKDPNQQSETMNSPFSVFPSPANEKIQVDFASVTSGKGILKVMDISARTVLSKDIGYTNGLNRYQLNTIPLGNGIYFISLDLGENEIIKRIIISH